MEYMACGLPVVCCDSGGNRELVTDGVSGFVVPPGDDSALARRLHEIRASGRAAAMGAAGRERLARDFTVARMVASYTSVYEACVGVRGVGPPGPAEQEGPVHR
jgi:glycosyltransferase involved in cell wall biosynthesis